MASKSKFGLKCCATKTTSYFCCVACFGLFHPSCLERDFRKHTKIIENRMYCSEQCKQQNLNGNDRLKELFNKLEKLQKENHDLEKKLISKDEGIRSVLAEKNNILCTLQKENETLKSEMKNMEERREKNCIGKYSLICEQCYYFLKNVEKFKVKCMETQKKLYSMNLETIKNNNNAVLKSFVNETFVTENQIRPNKKSKRDDSDITIASLLKTSIENSFRSTTSTSASNDLIQLFNSHAKDNNKNNNNAALKSSVNQTLVTENKTRPNKKLKRNFSDITIDSLLKTSTENTNQSTTSTLASNDLIQSLNSYANDINELKGFREFAAKPSPTQSQRGNVSIIEVIMNYEDVASPEEDNSNKDKENEEDEYMTRKDLVAAGILSDYDSNTDSNIELINSEDDQNVSEIGGSNKSIVNTSQAVVKTEVKDNENPGFFNKKSTDGFYKCRLCDKKYKTSQGLHRHTKEKHGDEVKFYHCNYCSFFSLWKSALMRHYSVFHGNIFEMNNKSSTVKCHHCSFKTTSKDQLNHHILDIHAYKKFTRCTLCRARFSDVAAFAEHMETEHLPSSTSSRYCIKCSLKFSSDDDYEGHLKEKHGEIVCRTCKKIFGSKGEFHEHGRSVHSTSFGASVLP